jgi:hypothetical protein
VESDFIMHLEDEFSSYNDLKINDLLEYLFTAYGNITSINLIIIKRLTKDGTRHAFSKLSSQESNGAATMQPTVISSTWTSRSLQNCTPSYPTPACITRHSKMGWSPGCPKTCDAFSKHIVHAQNNLQNKKTSKQHGYGMAVEQMLELTQNFANMVTSNWQEKENETNHYLIMRSGTAELKAIISKLQQQPAPKTPAWDRFWSWKLLPWVLSGTQTQAKHVNPKNLATRTKQPTQTRSMDCRLERLKRDNMRWSMIAALTL